jgi:hypothetical protein
LTKAASAAMLTPARDGSRLQIASTGGVKMKHRKNSLLRALGASMLAALALTAIAASSAQASGNGLWLVNLANPATFPVSVDGLVGSHASLGVLNVGSLLFLGLTLDCTKATITGTLTSSTHGKGTAHFQGCRFLIDASTHSSVCLVVNELILTEPLLAELLLLGTVVRFRPLTGLILAKYNVLSHEEECSFFIGHTKTFNIEGETCGEIVETDKIKLLLQTDLNSKHCQIPAAQGGHLLLIGQGNHAEIHTHQNLLILATTGGSKVTTHA